MTLVLNTIDIEQALVGFTPLRSLPCTANSWEHHQRARQREQARVVHQSSRAESFRPDINRLYD